jgi:spore coat protein SA
MKIAIITSGILPVPAVQGGAVENLIDYYLEYNEKVEENDITIYSIYDKKAKSTSLVANSKHTHFSYINDKSLWYRMRRKVFGIFHNKVDLYYNHYIEFFLFNVIKYLKVRKYDTIIMENRPGYTLKIHRECPLANLVLHLHNDLLNLNTPHSADILNALSLVVTVSDFIKNQVNTITFSDKVITCYNGIDINRFSIKQKKESERYRFGFKNSDFIVLYSGRIIPEKGVKELIDGFIQVLSYHDDIKLLIAGGNFFGNEIINNDYTKQLHKMSCSYKYNIKFTGFIPYDDIPSLLKCCDIGVIPSIWDDPFPLSCLEGLAGGLPLIVTRSGGMPEIVNNECAIILERNDNLSRSIADSILLLYEDDALRYRMSQNAIKRVGPFNKETFASNFLMLIHKFTS